MLLYKDLLPRKLNHSTVYDVNGNLVDSAGQYLAKNQECDGPVVSSPAAICYRQTGALETGERNTSPLFKNSRGKVCCSPLWIYGRSTLSAHLTDYYTACASKKTGSRVYLVTRCIIRTHHHCTIRDANEDWKNESLHNFRE